MPRPSLHLFMLRPYEAPKWARLVVQPIARCWVAMLLNAEESLPEPGTLQGLCFLGESPEEARGQALQFLGHASSAN